MNRRHFIIWDFLAMTWDSALWSAVPGFAIKYNYFRVDPREYAQRQATTPCTIEVHGHRPPAERTRGLRPVAERFAMGDGIFEVGHQHGRMRWTSWIAGLDEDHVEIWYEFPVLRRLQWPWFMFPDHLICFHVVQPVIEYKLAEQDIAVLHAGAAADGDEAFLLAGRGGVNKTTYLMALLRAGWEYLADDLVLLKDGLLHAYPMCDTFFDYFYLREADEKVTVRWMIGAYRHVRKNKPISFPVAGPTPISAVTLLLGHESDETRCASTGTVDDEMLDRLTAVDALERLHFVDCEEAMGRFLLHLNQVRGTDDWQRFWSHHRSLLKRNMAGLPAKVVMSGKIPDAAIVLPDKAMPTGGTIGSNAG